MTSGDWTVKEINVLKRDDLSSCCSDAFSVVGFELVLKRKPMYFVLNLIVPSAILCVLSLLSFIIPSESGERIGFITTILLAMSVYLLIIADVLPETSKEIPVTGLLFIVAIGLCSHAVMQLCSYPHSNHHCPQMLSWHRRTTSVAAKILLLLLPVSW